MNKRYNECLSFTLAVHSPCMFDSYMVWMIHKLLWIFHWTICYNSLDKNRLKSSLWGLISLDSRFINYWFLLMHVIDKMQKIENSKIQSYTNHNDHSICFGKSLQEKNELESEAALLSFLCSGKSAITKEKTLSMELPETCCLIGCYKSLNPPCFALSLPLPVTLLYYGARYNRNEWNPFSS